MSHGAVASPLRTLDYAPSCQSLIPEAGHQYPSTHLWEAYREAFRAGFNLEKMYRQAACRQPATYPPKCDSLIKIKAERTESAKWITRQCPGKRGIGKVSFIRQIFYVDRNLHFFYAIRNGSIENDVRGNSQKI